MSELSGCSVFGWRWPFWSIPLPVASRNSGNFNAQVRELVAEHIKTLPEGQGKVLEGLKRFHHTFASEWREAGGSLAALQRILGHSTIRVTEQYGEIADDIVLREFRRIEAEAAGTKIERDAVSGGGTRIRTGE